MATKVQSEAPSQSVGPQYRPDGQKPTATVSTEVSHENVHILPQTPQLIALLTYVPVLQSVFQHNSIDGIRRTA